MSTLTAVNCVVGLYNLTVIITMARVLIAQRRRRTAR